MSAPGVSRYAGGLRFTVRSEDAEQLWLCLFDDEDHERRIPMHRDGALHVADIPGVTDGIRYGYRAQGRWAPEQGLRFDESKLLVDPYAVELDRPFVRDARLSERGVDTAALMPRAVARPVLPDVEHRPPGFWPGGLIYELNVRGFTMRHPEVPEAQRGTIAALAHPAVIAHLCKIGVAAVELMPIVAWIDEAHLSPLGLRNAWGYNPVAMMALDPRLAPGGVAELRETVAKLHDAGFAVLLDLVFNHSGESDAQGATLSMRGLDNRRYYAHADDGTLINDSGCGNILDFGQQAVRDLTLDALRHFVCHAGIDGFRFDLAPILARSPAFDADAPIFAAIQDCPILSDRVMIAEPWDIGPGGYQLGAFPHQWLEWNDRYRDDVRRFWRGDGSVAALAGRISGSEDVFGPDWARGVNFIAAHDGFTLADLVAFEERHNHANGEDNRDGHGENYSWNNGAEGSTDDPEIRDRRRADLFALLTTLFATRGTIMLTAGDEFGRGQGGNNNAYAQDNRIGWLDWEARDTALEEHVAALSELRRSCPELFDPHMRHDLRWYRLDGVEMSEDDWREEAPPGVEMHVDRPGGVTIVRFDRQARIAEIRRD
jgi:glycogen operon protein